MSEKIGSYHFEAEGLLNPYDLQSQLKFIAEEPMMAILSWQKMGCSLKQVAVNLSRTRSQLDTILVNQPQSISADKDFINFYKGGNDSIQYYQGLLAILKRAGYEQTEVTEFLESYRDKLVIEQQKEFDGITQNALKLIYEF